MIGRARSIIILFTTIAIVGAGAATAVGQIRQRRRPRAHYDTTLPTKAGRVPWPAIDRERLPFRGSR